MNRICIYPKDIQSFTGKSERQSRKIISDIKRHLNRERHQVITVKEFCNYMGLETAEVTRFIK